MDYSNFAVSLGCNFMGKWFVALHCKMIHYFIIRVWGREFMNKGNPQIP